VRIAPGVAISRIHRSALGYLDCGDIPSVHLSLKTQLSPCMCKVLDVVASCRHAGLGEEDSVAMSYSVGLLC